MNLIKYLGFGASFDFLRWRNVALLFSSLLVLASIGVFLTRGLNFGIDFRGGVEIETRFVEAPDVSALRSEVNSLGIGEIGLQTFGEPRDVLFTMQSFPGDSEADQAAARDAAVNQLTGALGTRIAEVRRIETVGPKVSDELKTKAFWAMVYALLGIAVYIALRFEWRFAVAALVALTHDVLSTVGLFALFQLEFNLATVAAILTIAGYSINDTVVVFDRVREELRKMKSMDTGAIINLALNRTLTRTLMTSLTTLLALFALVAFGGPVIRGFAVALIWGIMIGTYSSLFVATPLLFLFRVQRTSFEKKAKDQTSDGAAAFVQKLAAEEKEARRLSEQAAANFDHPDDQPQVMFPEGAPLQPAAKRGRKPKAGGKARQR